MGVLFTLIFIPSSQGGLGPAGGYNLALPFDQEAREQRFLLRCRKEIILFYWRLHLALRPVGIEKYKIDDEGKETSESPQGSHQASMPLSWVTMGGKISYRCLDCCIVFLDRVSLCSPGCPETCSIDQAALKLTEVCLSLSPECCN